MKKIFGVIAIIAIVALVFTGCSGKKETSGGSATSSSRSSGGNVTVNVVNMGINASSAYALIRIDNDVDLDEKDFSISSGIIDFANKINAGEVDGKMWYQWAIYFDNTQGNFTVTINKNGYTFVPSTVDF